MFTANGGNVGAACAVIVDADGFVRRFRSVVTALQNVVPRSQCRCNRDLSLGLFCKRHANGVAKSIFQQRANTNGTLYASIFAIAGLGHTKVQRIGA